MARTGKIVIVAVLFFSALISVPAKTYCQSIPPDSVSNPDYIQKLITYSREFPFIEYKENFIEWCNYSAISSFFDKMKHTGQRKLKIIHIGDSHIQTDMLTGFMRTQLQKMFGYGGRGFIFPYNAAGTHSAYDYRTTCKGTWSYCRNIHANPAYDLGLTGATVRTTDTAASFRFAFLFGNVKPDFTRLRIYLKKSPKSYDLKLKIYGRPDTLRINCNKNNSLPYVSVDLPSVSDTLEFFIDKNDTNQRFFECYGLIIESPENKGVLYNSVGINGAGYKSILRENLMAGQLKELRPDLFILDMGSNDFTARRIYVDEMKKDISAIVDIVKNASPETNIIITSCQDFYKRKVNVAECKQFSELVKEVAIAKNCAFYNYYNVSGGRFAMMKWISSGLAQRDKVHLNHAGYDIRGELFLNAILNSYRLTLTRSKNDTLLVSRIDTSNIKAIVDVTKINTEELIRKSLGEKRDSASGYSSVVNPKQNSGFTAASGNSEKTYYKIKPGDNLGAIAQKFHVTVSQLQQWNHLKGTNIVAGKTLTIYKKSNGNSSPANHNGGTKSGTANINTQSGTTGNGSRVTHKVVYGDTLWDLSVKYKVSMDQIRKLNNLKDNNLKVGSVIIISN